MTPVEQTEEIEKFIRNLELNHIDREEIDRICNIFVTSTNLWNFSDLVEKVQLEKLLRSILSYCLNEHLKDWELVDELLKFVSFVLCKSRELKQDQRTEESTECIKNTIQKVIIDLFYHNAHFKCEKDKIILQTSDLCDLKLNKQIKIVLIKIMNTLIKLINSMRIKLSQEINVILIFMLHKTNELILKDEGKVVFMTGLSRDVLFVFYYSVVEYFHNTLQDKVLFDYLNLILFQKKQLSVEVKFFIVTILSEFLSTFYQSDTDIMETESSERDTIGDAKENSQLPISNDLDSLQLKSFYRQLKEFSLEELTNVNQSTRKSALFVIQSLYHLECSKKKSKNVTWEKFFHIFETLEENQVHLIFPVIDDIDSCDNFVLRRILLARMFQNDNVTLIKAAIKRLHLLNNEPATIVTLLPTVMKALNNSGLFVPECEVVKERLVNIFGLLNKPYVNEKYYLNLLNAIMTVPWGPVPLFYVSQYLQLSSNSLEAGFLYSNEHSSKISLVFKTVTNLLQLNFKHNQIIRSAIDFCLRKHMTISLILPLKQINIVLDNMDLVEVFDNFLNTCKPEDKDIFKSLLADLAQSLCYSEKFVNDYMKEHFISENNNQIQEFSFNMIALFVMSGKIKPTKILSLINENSNFILQSFENIITMNKFAVQYPFLSSLIWCCIESSNPDKGCCFIHSFLAEYYTEDQFKEHLLEVLKNENHEKYKDGIEFLLKHGKSARRFLKSQLFDSTIDFSKKHFGYFLSEYNYLYMFNLFYNSYGSDEYFLQNKKQLHALFNKDDFFNCENRKSVELKLRMLNRLSQGREGDEILLDLFIFSGLCIECLSNTNRDLLPVVLEIMEILIFFCLKNHYEDRRARINEIYIQFIRASYQEVKNAKKTTSFRSNMSAWIFSIFPALNVEDFHSVLMECIGDILEHEESSYRLFKRVSRSICYSIKNSVKYEMFLLNLLEKGLVYGELPKKDILVEQTVCEFIRRKKMGKMSHMQFHYSCRIRYKCTLAMVYYTGVCKNEHWGILLLDRLKEIFDAKQVRVQYFHNSLTHRIKQRAIQNIILLDHIISDLNVKKDLFVWGLENILNYNHQPSIRYFLELLTIKNLEDLNSTELFWHYFDRAYDQRPGSIVSFLCIIFHVLQRIIASSGPYSERQVSLMDEALERITLCSMSQLFNLRLYANVVFIKLYQALGLNLTVLSQKYLMVYNAMMRTKTGAKGNAILNADKLTTDFYFTRFHPISQFSLETIFYELPRLADVAPDEWGHWGTILEEEQALSIVEGVVRVLNTQEETLRDVTQPEWIVANHGRQFAEETSDSAARTDGPLPSSAVSQKKFIPMKASALFTLVNTPDFSTTPRSELIIVTSLIDKIPNIGGLSRSCEVFGATLVVENLDILRDTEFKALSMTSEKHVNIVEVRRHNLKTYLMDMRRDEGYLIIGAEQTTNSVKLQHFKYPKKSILVLGNERDGIKSDILALMDTYVEVPQLGVLRSLNVHVTGALFIWEFVKQHCLSIDST